MELPANSPPVLVSASKSIELHARKLFDDEVLGDGLVERSTNTELVNKLPDAESLCDGFVECGTDTEPVRKLVDAEAARDGFVECSTNAELVNKLPDAEALSEGFVDGTTETTVSFGFSSGSSCESKPPLEDASTGLLEVPCSCEGMIPARPVDPPDLSNVSPSLITLPMRAVSLATEIEDFAAVSGQVSETTDAPLDRTNDEREKTRKFPVLLSEGESPVYDNSSDVVPRFNCEETLGRPDFSEPNGLESEKDSGSDSEGDDFQRASSSNAKHVLSAKEKMNTLADEPLQGILESKIAELENACTGTFKSEDDDSKSVRKRQLKEMRALVEGTDRSSEEKLRHLNAKYVQQVAETRKMEKEFVTLNRKCKQVNKEKDTLYAELTKSTALRQKLESLCRELQRQNKMLLDDSKRVASEEEQKRQELSGKFHSTVKDITSKLEEQGDERLRQLEENELLREKLKHFTQQYDIREQHFAHQLRTKSLEYQLLEVKLKQQEDLCSQAENKSRMYSEQIAQLLKTEQELRSQLALYGDKFEQFQETLTKSNEVFATFKSEMEKMSKTVKRLEKENLSLKKKCEKSDVSLIELLGERDVLRKQLQTTKTQKEKLEGLCRSLQLERKQQLVSVDTSNSFLPSQLDNLKLSSPE
ncbi:hypothetical protein Mapa_015176 [Marchantia paleacea]|nr:hypothetical protein Mapa_015176 [Marchantia paleacea]